MRLTAQIMHWKNKDILELRKDFHIAMLDYRATLEGRLQILDTDLDKYRRETWRVLSMDLPVAFGHL